MASKKFFNSQIDIESVGTANNPTLAIDTTSTSTFNHAIEAFNGNLSNNQGNYIFVGREGSTKNTGYIGYKYIGSGSNSNILTFGHWASDNLMNLTGDAKLGLGTESPSEKVHIVQNTSAHLVNLLEQDNASYEAWYEAKSQNNGLARFGISNNANAYAFYNMSVNHYRWYHTAGGFLMKLDSNGRLGLGTTTIDTNVKLDVAGAGHFESNGSGRVLYLDATSGNGNIIQFHKQGTNKWEVVGRDGTFYVYKNDGLGSGYKWQINSDGNHTITGNISVKNQLTHRSNNDTTTLYNTRNLEIPYQGSSGTFDFDPVALFGANRSGGYVMIEVNGWQTRFNAGYIHWRNNGTGSGTIGTGGVTFRQTAWSGSSSGAGISVSTVTSSADVIRVTLSGWHSNAHGWEAYIRYMR